MAAPILLAIFNKKKFIELLLILAHYLCQYRLIHAIVYGKLTRWILAYHYLCASYQYIRLHVRLYNLSKHYWHLQLRWALQFRRVTVVAPLPSNLDIPYSNLDILTSGLFAVRLTISCINMPP